MYLQDLLIVSILLWCGLQQSSADEYEPPVSIITKCPPAFLNRCECHHKPFGQLKRHSFVTNCTNANFNNASVLSYIPAETEVLIFKGNTFIELPINMLMKDKNEHFDKLFYVDFSSNNIRRIHGKAFHGMKWVQSMTLDNNDISLMNQNYKPRMFSHLETLEELHLDGAFDSKLVNDEFMHSLHEITGQLKNLSIITLRRNGIKSIDSHFFCSMPNLHEIYLTGNELTRYTLNASCLPNLTRVDVSQNQIATIDNATIAYFLSGPKMYHLNLSENSLACECPLLDFYHFVRHIINETSSIKLESIEKFRCLPNSGKGFARTFDSLSESDLNCHRNGGLILDAIAEDSEEEESDSDVKNRKIEANRRYRRYVTASYFIVGILLFILFGLIAMAAVLNKEYIYSSLGEFWNDVIAKSDYTPLDKDQPSSNGDPQSSTVTKRRGKQTRFHNEEIAEDAV